MVQGPEHSTRLGLKPTSHQPLLPCLTSEDKPLPPGAREAGQHPLVTVCSGVHQRTVKCSTKM